MNKHVSLKWVLCSGLAICAVLTAGLLGLSTDAVAASWDAGDWKLTMGGNVNAFYVYTACDSGDLKSGGVTYSSLNCLGATDKNGNPDDYSSVQNGLLPASLNFSAATNQDGWDISANINVYYGIVSRGTGRNDAYTDANADGSDDFNGADALKFSTVDARQVYLTFGKKNVGTVKMGRDFGLFALDSILNDMSLLGVGAGFVGADPGHTTLGGLAFGYVYTDRLAQINYSTPNWGGFQGTLGIFQPFDANGARSAQNPGYHAKVGYSWDGVVKGMVSATYLQQDVITNDAAPFKDEEIKGWDVFAKVSFMDFSLLGYYFDAEGMTSLAIGGLVFPGFGNDAVTDVAGTPEEVSGYMAQGTYTLGGKVRFGINYAENEMDKVTLMENKKLTFGVYYNLTPALTLLAEYSDVESELKNAGTDETQNYTVGAILFF